MLCTVDGLKAFHGERVGLRLVPAWPSTTGDRPPSPRRACTAAPSRSPFRRDPRPRRDPAGALGQRLCLRLRLAHRLRLGQALAGLRADVRALRRHLAASPACPGRLITSSRASSRSRARSASPARRRGRGRVRRPHDAWYFAENGARTMPFCVLLEAALQPCGWLASYIGSALTTEDDLLFRNLDGTGTVLAEITPSPARCAPTSRWSRSRSPRG